MSKRYLILGCGNFGMNVAKKLFELGEEVIVIDKNKELIKEVEKYSTQAVIADVMDKELLQSFGVSDVDVAIVSMGNRLDASILSTLFLKELGIKRIIVKAISDDHKKILEKIGATDVVFPEKDMAEKVAQSLHSPNVFEHLALDPNYEIIEMATPKKFVGKTLKELELRGKHGIQVIGIKNGDTKKVTIIPDPEDTIKENDILILIGKKETFEKLFS